MTLNLPSRQQRHAAIALFVFALALVWLTVIGPVMSVAQDHTEKRQLTLRALGRERALLQEEPRIVAALATLDHSARWERLYASRKPEQATLEMETDLRKIITSPNNPTSMVAQGVVIAGPLSKVAVKITLSMPIDQLADTLARMQAHTKFLRIEDLLIQAPDYTPADANPILSIQADVAGYFLTPQKSST